VKGKHFVILAVAVFIVSRGNYALAQTPLPDLSGLLPPDGEIIGMKLEEPPRTFKGDELFIMIDGGADVYHEYGFSQVIAVNYIGLSGAALKLEIYEMATPEAAYGIFTFKIGDTGTHLAIGQGAVFEDYYLNFWKGNLLITIIGSDSNEETRQNIIAMAQAVNSRIGQTGTRPAIAELMLRAPVKLSHPKYIRGLLGVMNTYMFDTRNVFHVREGMTGIVNGCRVFVFQYPNGVQSNAAFEQAIGHFKEGKRFTNQARKDTIYRMSGRDGECIVIQEASPYIVVAISPDNDSDKAKDVSKRLVLKLSNQPE
jgi:hypothetical protein